MGNIVKHNKATGGVCVRCDDGRYAYFRLWLGYRVADGDRVQFDHLEKRGPTFLTLAKEPEERMAVFNSIIGLPEHAAMALVS